MKYVQSPEFEAGMAAAISAMMHGLTDAVADDAQRNAPVETGELRDSIEGEVSGTTGRVSATSDHAAYVELGTENMSAQPYLRPALYKKRSL